LIAADRRVRARVLGSGLVKLSETSEIEVRTPVGAALPAQPALTPDLGTIDWYSDWWDGGGSTAINAWTATPTWDGDAVDYEAVVGAIVTG
jgi:hypothetical protein